MFVQYDWNEVKNALIFHSVIGEAAALQILINFVFTGGKMHLNCCFYFHFRTFDLWLDLQRKENGF